jgi:hypothetical protein
MSEIDPWRHPSEPHPHELHRWESEGGRVHHDQGPAPAPARPQGGPNMLRMLAVLLILLALLGGGVGFAVHVGMELIWLFIVLLLVGVILGAVSYPR